MQNQERIYFNTIYNMHSFYNVKGKLIFNYLLLITLFIPIVLIMACIALCLFVMQGRPIFYKQKRVGKNGKPFHVLKFRTMQLLYDENNQLLPDHDRITKIGYFLRKTSMDEMPNIFNVMIGEISFVGPRPLLMQYLNRYTPEQARRHEVKPGITGWAQVNGRNAISWEEKFKLDVWYVDNMSFALDMKILWMTIWKVLKRSDISQEGHATMEEFMGTEAKKQA